MRRLHALTLLLALAACGAERRVNDDTSGTTDAGTGGTSSIAPVPAQEAIDTCRAMCAQRRTCAIEDDGLNGSGCDADCLNASQGWVAEVFRSLMSCLGAAECASQATCQARTNLLLGDREPTAEQASVVEPCRTRATECATAFAANGEFDPSCDTLASATMSSVGIDNCLDCLASACASIPSCWYGSSGCR